MCSFTGDREHKETCAYISPDSASLSLADPIVYPFDVINISHEYNYMMSLVSHSSKSPNMGMFLETPSIPHYKLLCQSVTYGYYQKT